MVIIEQSNQGVKNVVTIPAEDMHMGIKSSETKAEQDNNNVAHQHLGVQSEVKHQEHSRDYEGDHQRNHEAEYQRAVENIRTEIKQRLINRDIVVSFTGMGLTTYPSYREISRIVEDYAPEHHALVTSILQEEYNNYVTSLLLDTKEQSDKIGIAVAAAAIAAVRSNFRTAGITNMEVRPWIVTKCSEVLAPVLTDRALPENKQKELMEASVKAANRCFQRMFQQRMILCADFQHAV